MVVLAASQMVAIGNFLKIFLGTSYLWSLALGTAVVLFYSICGGFFSVVVADCFKFLLLLAGMASLFFFLASHSSFSEIQSLALPLGKSHYFNFFFNFKKNSLMTFSFTLAWIISPIAWQRIQAAQTVEKAKKALFAASGTFFLLYWLAVIIGCFSLPLFSSPKFESLLLSELISSKTGIFLGGLVFVAVVAAIMSTMDSAINTGALSLTRDIYQQIFPSTRAQGIVQVSRLSTFFVGAMAFLVATQFQDILKTIGLASEIMAEGLFIPGLAMIFLKRKLPMAGFLSLLLGGGFSVITFLGEVNLLPLE
jgi:SSS family solute:Na+ symporter